MADNGLTSQRRVLDIRNLSVSFGQGATAVHAVKGLSLHVDRGETLAIVGESGSGKSVTSLAIMRLVEFGGGHIHQGEMLFHRSEGTQIDLRAASEEVMRSMRGADLGMIFQEPMTSLNPVFTVGSQIIEAIQLHQDVNHEQAVAAAKRILDQVRISDSSAILGRYPHELSGGMRQRVMIAMALSCKPALLIADEPTTALDVTIQAQILQLIRELQKEMDMGVIFITHDMGVVAEVANRVMVMRYGEVVEENAVIPLFANPQHPYTQTLLAAVPKLGAMHGTDQPARFDLVLNRAAKLAEQAALAGAAPIDTPVESLLQAGPGQGDTQSDTKSDTKSDGQSDAESETSGNTQTERVVLSVKNLVTRFDVRSGIFGFVKKRIHAVEQVSFDLHEGETLSLVGESGCGKTTTGRSLVGLAKITRGTIDFDGTRVDTTNTQSLKALRRNLQFVFQDPFASLNPRMRVGDCIKEPLLIQGLAQGLEADRKVAELMERVGLDAAMAQRWPHEFSGGQRQRICIARALSVNPRVLIADESVSALDVSIRAHIVNLLIDLQKDLGVSYLFISHDMAIVERVSHRVAVMYLGQIVEIGPRRAIFENPQHPYTRKLMSAVPVADPNVRRTTSLEVSEIPSPARNIGDEPVVLPLVQVGEGHFVAQHRIGGQY
ncbi:MAG: dipeptide ABC transporter ATP-binding protein [Candidatus Methylopumilus sp.]|nr:dipeptide ABC transporter ATP-binding protein [Candidatus Methylopumilus sp.]